MTNASLRTLLRIFCAGVPPYSDNKQCQSHDLLEGETMRPCHVHQHFHIFSNATFFVRRFRQKRSELKTPLAWGICVHLKTTRPSRDKKQSCNNFFLGYIELDLKFDLFEKFLASSMAFGEKIIVSRSGKIDVVKQIGRKPLPIYLEFYMVKHVMEETVMDQVQEHY